jgi:tetrahedral aminopeptidase
MKSLIKKLVEATGPSGYEHQIRDIIRAEIAEYADDIRVDALGNLIATKGKLTPDGKKIMLAGHMDEIGVIVTHIDENGFLRFNTIGGVRAHTLVGGRVKFVNGTLGVIHMERPVDMQKLPAIDTLFIDVGAKNKESCPVKVGEVAGFDRPFIDLGQRLVSKAMDDRIAVAIMIEALKKITNTPHELYFVFTTQEEVGCRGAQTAAFGIHPDIGLAVDVTGVGDTPKGVTMEVSLGKGPAVKVKDSSLVVDPRLVRWMAETAEKIGIPYQYEVLIAGGTDAGAMNLTHAGAPSICLSVPTRYIHSPSEMVDYDDVQNSVKLLVELITQPIILQ